MISHLKGNNNFMENYFLKYTKSPQKYISSAQIRNNIFLSCLLLPFRYIGKEACVFAYHIIFSLKLVDTYANIIFRSQWIPEAGICGDHFQLPKKKKQ
jgi:dolichol kinase